MKLTQILESAAKKSDAAEVYTSRRTSLSVSYENNLIKDSSSSDLSGVAIRMIKDGKQGFSSSTRPDDARLVDLVADLTQFGKPVKYDFAPVSDLIPFKSFPENLDKHDEAATLAACEDAVSKLCKLGDGVLAFSGITKNISTSRLLNTKGVDISQEVAMFTWYAGLTHNTEGNFIQVYDYKIGDDFEGFDAIIEDVAESYRLCANNTKVPTGKYRVLLSPRGVAQMLMVFNACLSGKAVSKGISPWTDKLGAELFDPRFSLLTDLESPDSPVRMAFDGEGIPTGKKVLIENGVLKSFYHNLDSAGECGQAPTGHGFRNGISASPAPSLSCIRIAPHTASIDEMRVDSQVWVDEMIGAIMSNPYAGIISGNVSLGFDVVGGQKQSRLKDVMMTVNVFDAFKNGIVAISKETARVGDSILPYMLLEGVTLSS